MGVEARRDNIGLSPPSLGSVLATIVGTAALLYPFGLLVFERQLELAYNFDSTTAWHITSLIAQNEVVTHGLQSLITPATLVLAVSYLFNAVMPAWHASRAFRSTSMVRETQGNMGEVKAVLGTAEAEVAKMRDAHAESIAKQAAIEEELRQSGTVDAADRTAIEDQISRARTEGAASLAAGEDQISQAIAKAQAILAQAELLVKGEQRQERVQWVFAGPLAVIAVASPVTLIVTQPSLANVLWSIVAVVSVLAAIYFSYRHIRLNQGKLLPFSQWLLWGLVLAYGAVLITAYFSLSVPRSGLLPPITVVVRGGHQVTGGIVNEVDRNWYIVVSPVTAMNGHKRITTRPAQVRVIGDTETESVVIGLIGPIISNQRSSQ